jgi:hypothetical protein
MPVVRRNNTRGHGNAIISDKVKSHVNDPFFVKKLEEAKEALSKITLPGSIRK